MIRGFLVFLALFCTLAAVRPADAQSGQFAPVLTVNGMPITGYELDQRRLFLQIVRAPGDPEALAREALIEDRLRMHAAKRLGIKLTPEQVMAGMEEFASRANLSAEQFVEAIGQGGVQPETFRDFVTAGLVWREVIRVEFGGSVTISEADIDRAVALTSQRGAGVRVLLSEIIVSAAPGGGAQAEATLRELTETIRSEARAQGRLVGIGLATAQQRSVYGPTEFWFWYDAPGLTSVPESVGLSLGPTGEFIATMFSPFWGNSPETVVAQGDALRLYGVERGDGAGSAVALFVARILGRRRQLVEPRSWIAKIIRIGVMGDVPFEIASFARDTSELVQELADLAGASRLG